MKLTKQTKSIFGAFLICGLSLGFFSCSNDDDTPDSNGTLLPLREYWDGGEHKYFYTSNNLIDSISEIEYEDAAKLNADFDAQKYIYGSDGKLIKWIDYNKDLVNGTFVDQNRYEYTLTYAGNTITEKETEYEGSVVVTPQRTSAVYEIDNLGRLIEYTSYWGSQSYINTYEYDAKGNISKSIDGKNNTNYTLYEYDDKHGILKNIGNPIWEAILVNREYSRINNCIKTTYYSDGVARDTDQITMQYNSDGYVESYASPGETTMRVEYLRK